MRNTAPVLRPLGEFIEECDERNEGGQYSEQDLLGVNNRQEFCTTRANTTDIDFHPYKVVRKDDFVYNPARLDIGSIAKFDGDVCIVSTLYEVFRIRGDKQKELLPEFMQVYFARSEFARYVGFKNWGSAREYFWIDSMRRTPIPVPSLPVQRKVVETWQGLRRMKDENEKLVEPLMQLCRSYLQDCKKKYPMVELGPYVKRIDERNTDGSVHIVKSVSVTKEFKDTNAKVDKGNLFGYKIVMPEELSFVQTTGNEKCLCIAVNHFDEPIVVTSVNEVFQIDEEKLKADYLYLWCCRPEFDRYARFNSWGSARETFSWADMCRVKIPLPPIEVQRAIVDVYRCANEAKKIAEEADRLSREICPALVRFAAESKEGECR